MHNMHLSAEQPKAKSQQPAANGQRRTHNHFFLLNHPNIAKESIAMKPITP